MHVQGDGGGGLDAAEVDAAFGAKDLLTSGRTQRLGDVVFVAGDIGQAVGVFRQVDHAKRLPIQ